MWKKAGQRYHNSYILDCLQYSIYQHSYSCSVIIRYGENDWSAPNSLRCSFNSRLSVLHIGIQPFTTLPNPQSSILKSLIYKLKLLSTERHNCALYNYNQLEYSLLLWQHLSQRRNDSAKGFFFVTDNTVNPDPYQMYHHSAGRFLCSLAGKARTKRFNSHTANREMRVSYTKVTKDLHDS